MVVCLSYTPDAPSRRSLFLNRRSFSSLKALTLLQKCANFNHLKLIHAKIIRNGLAFDQILVRKLLHLCSSYGKMDYATVLFHQIHDPHTFTWNVMIRAYTLNGASPEALFLYNLMISQGFPPDKFTFPFVVKACSASSAIHKGKEVHGLAIKTGLSKDTFLQNTLMDLYLKCGNVKSGRKVFYKMRIRNVVSWTTFVTGLVACGDLDAAQEIFEQMPTRNVVSWTALINGYTRSQRPQEAFEVFRRMQLDNVRPNEFTLVSLLKACTEIGSLKLGSWIHDYALKNGFKLGFFLGTALIDMYSKCDSLGDARQVFDKMQTKNVATWNTMITSLGVHGCGKEALALFAEMERGNVQPDAITFLGVLCACVHTINVKDGERYFKYMKERYCIAPDLAHYACMVELYSHANMPNEVWKLVNSLPVDLINNTTMASIRPSVIDGIANIKKSFEHHGREILCPGTFSRPGTGSRYSSLYQLECFKLEVR